MKDSLDKNILPIGTLFTDAQFRIINVDSFFLSHFGCQTNDVIGKMFEDLIDKHEKNGSFRFHKAISEYVNNFMDIGIISINLNETTFLVRVQILQTEYGWNLFVEALAPTGTILQLRLEQLRWRSIFEVTSDGILYLDSKNHITDFNPCFYSLMKLLSKKGIPFQEDALIGKDFFSILEKSSQLFCLKDKIIEQKMKKKPGVLKELLHGKNFLDVKILPTYLPGQETAEFCCVLIFKDISRERELQTLRIKSAEYSGMAQAGTGVIHNIGNIANGINIGLYSLAQSLDKSKLYGLNKCANLIREQGTNLGQFIMTDPKGPALIDYISAAIKELNNEHDSLRTEVSSLQEKLDLVKNVIRDQQEFAKGTKFIETLDINELIEEVLRLQHGSIRRHEIKIQKYLCQVPKVNAQKSKLMHVLINLFVNAKDSLETVPSEKRQLILRTWLGEDGVTHFSITDTGGGISTENLTKIFSHGFTTKPGGNGFGLHFCATALLDMNGSIQARSDGIDRGATFELTLTTVDAAVRYDETA